MENKFEVGQTVINNDPICLYRGRKMIVKARGYFRCSTYDGWIYTIEMPSGTGNGSISMAARESNLVAEG